MSSRKCSLITFSYLLLIFAFTACKTSSEKSVPQTLHVVPLPAQVTFHQGSLTLPEEIRLSVPSRVREIVSLLLAGANTSSHIFIFTENDAHVQIAIDSSQHLPSEGYRLTVLNKSIRIAASDEAGLFYGLQTFLQMLAVYGNELPCGEIIDFPRFSYRGLHLDVGRHMFPADFIKRYIDLMSRFKFNRFHWHLTEDQGWRIEIKKYPRLQEVAAWRDETIVGHAGSSKTYDGKRYGGYYTQEEIRDIVAYAASRHVTIIPEIEMPGHSRAALAAYPQLGCTGGPYTVATTWGVFDDVYCAGKEETFSFLQDVLDEVIDLFPGTYIHIGGDECPKKRWKQCRWCQWRIKKENLKDEDELQSYFIRRIEQYLNGKGMQIIGWDEILEGGLAPRATVMSWRGEAGGIEAARQKHTVIMTPGNWCYFDHYQHDPDTEPLAIGGLTPVSEVYAYEPIPGALTPAEAAFIIGAQGNLWTEYIPTPEHAEYMAYPRALALAEVVWSPAEKKNYSDFIERLRLLRPYLDNLKINYATHVFHTPDAKWKK